MHTIDIKTVDLDKIFPKQVELFNAGLYGNKKIVVEFDLYHNIFEFVVYEKDVEIKRYNSISLAIKKYNSLEG